ncbi:MAG: segregation/condensation protein A [Phycisphaerales bacterium]
MSDEYRVRLEAFEGPLDLLLFLIRKNEVDIHDIPIAAITDQYVGMVGQLQGADAARLDIDAAGEFLVMAATLMEIKSRMLLPKPVQAAAVDGAPAKPAEDPRAELVRQLLEYKRFRDAADDLERRNSEWQRRFPAGRAHVDDGAMQQAMAGEPDVEVEDLDLLDLIEAFKKVQETVNFERLGDHQVTYDDTPIELHAQDILSRLHDQRGRASAGEGGLVPAGAEMEFRDVFTGRTRGESVGLFLALLELVRNRKVRVRQDKVEGSIWLSAREEEAAAAEGAAGVEGASAAAEPPAGA